MYVADLASECVHGLPCRALAQWWEVASGEEDEAVARK